jgi:hypothetical protein
MLAVVLRCDSLRFTASDYKVKGSTEYIHEPESSKKQNGHIFDPENKGDTVLQTIPVSTGSNLRRQAAV